MSETIKDYELRPAASGDYLVFHDLRAANRPPDAALSPVEVAFLGIEDKARAVVAERDFYRGELDRAELNAAKWRSRYRSMCDFSAVSVALLAASIIAHLWRSL